MGLFGDSGGNSGGLFGMFNDPDKFAALAMIAKGASPYSDLDPAALMKMAQLQREHGADRAFREKQLQFQKEKAARDDERDDKRFAQSQLTPAAKAAMDFDYKPGTEEYKEFMKDYYKLKGQGWTPITIKQNGEETTVFQKGNEFATPDQLGLVRMDSTGESAIGAPPPGVDVREWRKERTKMLVKDEASRPAREETAKNVVADIDRATAVVDKSTLPTTGLGGQALKNIPGTGAHDLDQILSGIKANVSFDKLQEMRNASPSGAALGQISDKENQLLQRTIASLEQSQSPEQFKENLARVRQTFDRIIHGDKNAAKVDVPKVRLRYDPATGELK
jgi:hypothetical protein